MGNHHNLHALALSDLGDELRQPVGVALRHERERLVKEQDLARARGEQNHDQLQHKPDDHRHAAAARFEHGRLDDLAVVLRPDDRLQGHLAASLPGHQAERKLVAEDVPQRPRGQVIEHLAGALLRLLADPREQGCGAGAQLGTFQMALDIRLSLLAGLGHLLGTPRLAVQVPPCGPDRRCEGRKVSGHQELPESSSRNGRCRQLPPGDGSASPPCQQGYRTGCGACRQ
jgi:hypothetical protein